VGVLGVSWNGPMERLRKYKDHNLNVLLHQTIN
jgi:hypothetical protein